MTDRFDHERVVDWVASQVVSRPGRIVVAFLVLTLAFGVGLSNVSTESGTQQFAGDIPAQEALEDINQEFGTPFGASTGSTQLIQKGDNVLSKKGLLAMLRTQERVREREDLRVETTSSPAAVVARTLDPTATTLDAQIDAVERATPSEIDAAVREAADNPAFTGGVSNDFNPQAAAASSTIGVVTHDIPNLDTGGAGQGGSSPLTPIQRQVSRVVETTATDSNIEVFGSGIIAEEFGNVISDSLLIVTPAAVVFIILFLSIAYRDLVDLLLGVFSLVMAVVWTFGFLGLAGIPFNTVMISIPPLLLAVGIDFGIHSVNRYREARQELEGGPGPGATPSGTDAGVDPGGRPATDGGDDGTPTTDGGFDPVVEFDEGPIAGAMRVTIRQLVVAFFIVTGTTVIGFMSNVTSPLAPLSDFGVAASVGIVFTFLLFGVFLPAAKVLVDRARRRYPIPTFSESPLGGEESALGDVLGVGVVLARRVPVLVLVFGLLLTVGAGYYTTDISTEFSQEDFLPPEETPPLLEALPEPLAPSEYSVVAQLNFLEDRYESSQGGSVVIYVEGRMERDTALEEIYRAGRDPPSTFVSENRRADSQSLVTVIRSQAERDPEFAALVDRNDRNGNGVPEDDLGRIYDELLASEAADQAAQYLADDRRSTRVVYATEADADQGLVTQQGRSVADRFRTPATATGETVVFQAVSDLILESAVVSLGVALLGTAVFLMFIYWLLEGEPTLGIANLIPILVAVASVGGSMRLFGIPFNSFTATILALTIGLGIDYSVHVVHRFIDEREEFGLDATLVRTVKGTGGALTGSMLTTVFGIGVLTLALLTPIGQFGVLTALSVIFSYLASLLVLPSVLVVWDRLFGPDSGGPKSGSTHTGPDPSSASVTGGDRV
jgi:predicted RND superfamily exporter protein